MKKRDKGDLFMDTATDRRQTHTPRWLQLRVSLRTAQHDTFHRCKVNTKRE